MKKLTPSVMKAGFIAVMAIWTLVGASFRRFDATRTVRIGIFKLENAFSRVEDAIPRRASRLGHSE